MKTTIKRTVLAIAGALLLVPLAQATVSTSQGKNGLTRLEQEVRHELVMLPWFGVFDDLEFQVNGNEVILGGQVTRPTLRSSAENVVKRIEGVEKVTNNIEVLPLSRFDDDIRVRTLRSIYSYAPLSRYGMGTMPSVRIIVKNGEITLKGVVANATDANLAYMRARQVPGAFAVNNQLRVENSRS